MTKEEVKHIIIQSIENLFIHQPNVFDLTIESRQSEWNLAHHVATEISKFLHEYDCDLEIIKPNLQEKRPDIIFHKRGTNEKNFLVIELKKDGDKSMMESDLDKIKSYWFSDRLRYKFGVVANINSDKTYQIEIIQS